MEFEEEEILAETPAEPERRIVAVAVNKGRNSKYAVSWALAEFMSQGHTLFLIHVRDRLQMIPTPLGGSVPISEASEEAVAAYQREINARTEELLRPYVRLCRSKKVEYIVLVREDEDVSGAICRQVSDFAIQHLVVGASARGIFGKFKGLDTPAAVSQKAPTFCSVYVISKGRLTSVCSATTTARDSVEEDSDGSSNVSTSALMHTRPVTIDVVPKRRLAFSQLGTPRTHITQRRSASLTIDRSHSLTISEESVLSQHSIAIGNSSSSKSLGSGSNGSTDTLKSDGKESPFKNTPRLASIRETTPPVMEGPFGGEGTGFSREMVRSYSSSEFLRNYSEGAGGSIYGSYVEDESVRSDDTTAMANASWYLTNSNASDVSSERTLSNQNDIMKELESLKLELKQTIGMYAQAREEAFLAKIKANEVNLRRLQEVQELEEAKRREELARRIAEQEMLRNEEILREAERAKQLAEMESHQRLEDQMRVARSLEKKREEAASVSSSPGYRTYTFEEIRAATVNFSESLKIGEGGYGTVYKGNLQHTVVAVKVLREQATQGIEQFHKEVEVLSHIRHPHMVLLLGACPEHGCLVYEYMANGGLDERLRCKNGSSPLPWFCRFRIAWEIASALNFLHSTKPNPIVHRDLKPGNILLDHNLVSKIGDVGLARLAPDCTTTMLTHFKTTVPAGTFCYIDPEYQRTGVFGPKSDVYALGMMLLQLITGKPPIGLTDTVEMAMDEEEFAEVLDRRAGEWPLEETLQLARLALKCAELRRRDRPDLEKDVLPHLLELKNVAEKANTRFMEEVHFGPPGAFICPISKEVMENPQVAADGFTYEYEEIQRWLDQNDTSPMTNLPMPHKNLIPNLTLRSAILEWEWKAKTHLGQPSFSV